MKYSIDRIVEGIAVCEDTENGKLTKIPAVVLPEDAKEGDIIETNGNQYEINRQLTAERKKRATERLRALRRHTLKKDSQ